MIQYHLRQIPEIIERPGVPDWVVSFKTDTWQYRMSCIRIDFGCIHVNLEFLIDLYFVGQDNWEYRLSCIQIDMWQWLSTIYYLLSTIYYLLSTIYYLLSTISRSMPNISKPLVKTAWADEEKFTRKTKFSKNALN